VKRGAWDIVMERDERSCQANTRGLAGLCDGWLVVHHILPRGRGGKDDIDNLITLCVGHHRHVHGNPAESYTLGLLARSAA
jgi:5-methylcytosine-specific restriction endonuclease McrA